MKFIPLIYDLQILLSQFSAILALFLHRKLHYDKNEATALFHAYQLIVYSLVVVGAVIAESWLGVFNTIATTLLLYSFGAAIVSISGIETLNLPLQ